MKVNLPPKLDRFNAFLTGGDSSTGDVTVKAAATTTSKLIINTSAERVVKNPSTAEKDENSEKKEKKVKGNTKEIIDLKREITLKGTIPVPKTSKIEDTSTTKKSLVTNASSNSVTKPCISKINPRSPTPHKFPPTHAQVSTVSSQSTHKPDLISKKIYTVSPNINGLKEAHFLTNELFPLSAKNKNDIFIKNSKQSNSIDNKIQYNPVSVRKDDVAKKTLNGNNDISDQNGDAIDLTIKPVIINDGKVTSSGNKKNDTASTKEPKSTSHRPTLNKINGTTCKSGNNERTTNSDKDKFKSPSKSKAIIYPEPYDSSTNVSTSIDDILSQNNSDLIPKSDVESLLKCLKRKLEEKEDAERAVKRAHLNLSESERNASNRPGLFDEPGDLFSSFDGSPASEEAASPNLFFQSRDMGSVSSVDSALSYNQQSSVSSENSDSNANTFDFLDEILAEDNNVYMDTDAIQNEIFDITNQENSNQFVSDIGLVDTLHNHTQGNIDFSFLENLKENYLDCENIFDSVENKDGSVVTSNEHLAKDKSSKSSYSTYNDNVSFPTEPADGVDLFDHLWNELDNL